MQECFEETAVPTSFLLEFRYIGHSCEGIHLGATHINSVYQFVYHHGLVS
jgi:hypothetical protein